MLLRKIGLVFGSLLLSGIAVADLEPWKDYDVSDTVLSVSTIRVNANMDDAYLEGIRETWVKSNELAKKLGQIVDYRIYRSDLPQSGDFNLLLVVEFANRQILPPTKHGTTRLSKRCQKKFSTKIPKWHNAITLPCGRLPASICCGKLLSNRPTPRRTGARLLSALSRAGAASGAHC